MAMQLGWDAYDVSLWGMLCPDTLTDAAGPCQVLPCWVVFLSGTQPGSTAAAAGTPAQVLSE